MTSADADVSCTYLVLTGGASSRLGTDKASLVLDGVSLRDRVCAALPVGQVHELGADLAGGPASAIIEFLPRVRTRLVGLVAVDMPFAAPLVMRLAAEWDPSSGCDGMVPVDAAGRDQWLCSVFETSALAAAADRFRVAGSARSGVAMRTLVADLSIIRVPLTDADIVMAMDIDTREDLAAVRSLMEQENADGA